MVLHIYLDYHTEMGQLIIIKKLCQKCLSYILYWLLNKYNFRRMDVYRFSQVTDFGGIKYSVLRLYLK